MDITGITIIILFGLIIFGILFVFNFVNRLFFYKNKIIDKFSSVGVLIDERAKIIDKVCEYLKVNCPHEDNLIRQLNSLVVNFENTTDINELLLLIDKSKSVLESSTNLESTYINLQNKKEYLDFKNIIKDNDGRIEFAMSVYNDAVDNYNKFRENKYISILSKLLKFPNYNYYK